MQRDLKEEIVSKCRSLGSKYTSEEDGGELGFGDTLVVKAWMCWEGAIVCGGQ